MATKKQLEEKLAILQQIAEAQGNAARQQEILNQLGSAQKKDVAAMARLLTTNEAQLRSILKTKQDTAKLAKQYNDDEHQAIAAKAEAEAATAQFVLNKLADKGAALKKHAAEVKKVDGEGLMSAKAAMAELNDGISGLSAQGGALGAAISGPFEAAFAGLGAKVATQFAAQMQGAGEVAGQGLAGGMQGSGADIAGAIGGGATKMLGIATDEVTAQGRRVLTGLRTVMEELDSVYSSYRKTVGIELPGAYDAFLAAMDDGSDMAEKFNATAKKGYEMTADIYIAPQDAGAAMQALTQQTNVFSSIMNSASAETQAMGGFLVNQVAAFKKLGIGVGTTAKVFQIASKAMNKQGLGMVKLTRQIAGVGKALDKDLNETMEDFTKMAPQLVQFGDNITGVFARLEAQSKATGIAAGDLLGVAMKFDTFEGAATAAGRLNAVLGDTVVDTMALIHASPDEKINMLREAVESTGTPFEEMDRRTQQVISGVLGLGNNIQQAQQLLGNTDAYEEFADKVTVTGEAGEITGEEIQQLAESAGSIDDRLKGAASNAANTLDAGTTLLQLSSKVIYGAADAVSGAADAVGDTLSGLGSLIGIGEGGEGVKGKKGSADVISPASAKSLENVAASAKSAEAQVADAHAKMQGSHDVALNAMEKGPSAAKAAKPASMLPDPETFKGLNAGAQAFSAKLDASTRSVMALAASLRELSGMASLTPLSTTAEKVAASMRTLGDTKDMAPLAKQTDALATSMKKLPEGGAFEGAFKALREGIPTGPVPGLAELEYTRMPGAPPAAAGGMPFEGMSRQMQLAMENMNLTSEELSILSEAIPGAMDGRTRPPEAEAMPVAALQEYMDALAAGGNKTLDTTNYIEKTVELAGMQEASSTEQIKKMDDLINVLSEKGTGDMKDHLNIVLRIGDREFNAQVIQALRDTRLG